jgi:hypothetical protein
VVAPLIEIALKFFQVREQRRQTLLSWTVAR